MGTDSVANPLVTLLTERGRDMAFSPKNARHYFTISALIPTQAEEPIEVQGGLTFLSPQDRAAFAAELAVSGGLAGVGAIGGLTGIVALSGLFLVGEDSISLNVSETGLQPTLVLAGMGNPTEAPQFPGQIGFQTSTKTIYSGASTDAGDWESNFRFGSVIGINSVQAGVPGSAQGTLAIYGPGGGQAVLFDATPITSVTRTLTIPDESGTLATRGYVASAISGLIGGVQYKGTWNASTNSPTIPAAAAGNKGFCYKVTTGGATSIDGVTDWKIGDMLISNGGSWDKIDNTDPLAQQLVQKLDFTTTPLAHSSTTVVSPTASVTEIAVSVGTSGAHSAVINLTGGVPGDQVIITFYGWTGGTSRGALFINSDGTNILTLFPGTTLGPQVVTIARSRDDAPNNADTNWFIVGRWYAGKPRGLSDHTYYKNDASIISIFGPQPASIAVYCNNLPWEGEQISFELNGSMATLFSVTLEFDTDSTYTGSIPVNVAGLTTNAQYLNALAVAMNSYHGGNFQVVEAFPPDAYTPNPPATLFMQFPAYGGDAYWGSSGTSTNIGLAWVLNGNMGNGAGTYDFGGTSVGTDIHGFVVCGDGSQGGIDQVLGVFYQNVPIGTIPASLAAGEYKLLDYISAHGRRIVQENPGGLMTIGLSAAPNTGRTRILLFPFNVSGQLTHL